MSKDLKKERAGAVWGLEEEPSRQRAKVLRQELPVCSKRAGWWEQKEDGRTGSEGRRSQESEER